MDSVLDFLFLRRLKFEYTCPPICPITPASGSSFGVTGQVISPILAMPPLLPGGLFNNFLSWNCAAGQVCYNIYLEVNGSFVEVITCVSANTLTLCSAGTWRIIPNTGQEVDVTTDGTHVTTVAIPPADSYTVLKDGVLVFAGSFCAAVEVCSSGCYSVSAITGDGETPPSDPTCVTIGSAFPYDTFEEYANGSALSGLNLGVNGSTPIAIWNPTNAYVAVSTGIGLLAWDTFEGYPNGAPLGGQNGGGGSWVGIPYVVS